MSSVAAPLGVLGTKLYDLFSFQIKPEKERKMNIVVVGYGWGGKSFCDNIDTKKYNVTVVSKNNYMLNTTKLKNSVTLPQNRIDKKLTLDNHKNVTFVIDECTNVNLSDREIEIKNGGKEHVDYINDRIAVVPTNKLPFDYLVVAVGSDVNDFGIPGVKENCYFLKSMEDLVTLKNSLESNVFKNAISTKTNQDNSIVILGGGPAGIELAFQLSKVYKNIKILEAMPTILPMFSPETVNMVKEELAKSKIELLLSSPASKIEKNEIISKVNKINYDVAIWTGGVKPNSFLKKFTDEKFIVDKNFKWKDGIFAIGDIVASKELGPPTGQNAKYQGKYLAEYFNNNFKGDGYKYEEKGKMVHTKDNIIIETKYGSFRVPYLIEPILDYFVEN